MERLPVLARVEAKGPTQLVLRGELSSAQRAQAVERARAVVEDVGRRFLAQAEPKRPVDVCLFDSARAYRHFSDTVMGERPSELGFYQPASRVVVVNLEAGPRNMSHELVHPLVHDDFPLVPSWLSEGLGSLYGGSDVTPRGVRFFVNYRNREVQAAISAGALPTVAELSAVRTEQVYGGQAMLWYGFSRAVLLFLESKGELSGFYAAARSGVPLSRALGDRLDDASLRRFASRAKPGERVVPERRPRGPGVSR
ncbi:MAG: hypothetical protein HYZ28_21805 [Myxococcales bacterium]|nr:hypothetical protein [Myxococcales bacterium]